MNLSTRIDTLISALDSVLEDLDERAIKYALREGSLSYFELKAILDRPVFAKLNDMVRRGIVTRQ